MQPEQPQGIPSANGSPPQIVQPQPTPFTPIVTTGTLGDGRSVVVLQLCTITGTTIVFLPPEGAQRLGEELIAQSKTAATGLILPPGGIIPGQ